MTTSLYVKLTASDNTFLQYPCYGLLEILETGTTGSIIVATFRVAESGKLSAAVRVQRPRFEYSPRTASHGHAAVVDLHNRQHEGRVQDAQRIACGEVEVVSYSPASEPRSAVFNPIADLGDHPAEVTDMLQQMARTELSPEARSAAINLGKALATRGTPTVAALVDEYNLVPELQDFAAALRRAAIPGA